MSNPSVLFVPGLPASHLHDIEDNDVRFFLNLWNSADPRLEGPSDLEALDEPVRAGEPIKKAASFLFFDLAKQAQYLYELLERLDHRPVHVGWDWRRPVYDAVFSDPKGPYSVQHRLADTIEVQAGDMGQVPVVVHSTGGLVLRSLLEKRPELCRKISKVLAFGVPWAGLLKSLEVLTGAGEIPIASPERAQEILVRSWAAWDLVPPDPTHLQDAEGDELLLTYRDTGGGPVPASALTDLDWLASLPQGLQKDAKERADSAHGHLRARRPRFDVEGERLEIVNVAGFGYETAFAAELRGTGSGTSLHVHKGKRDAILDGGDGTAPFRSATWLRGGDQVTVRSHEIPLGLVSGRLAFTPHSRIWNAPGASDLLRHHLTGEALDEVFCHAALDERDVRQRPEPPTIRLRAVAVDQGGAPLDDVVVQTRGAGWEDRQIRISQAGRLLVDVPARHFRRVHNGRARRLESRIGWRDQGQRRWRRIDFAMADAP